MGPVQEAMASYVDGLSGAGCLLHYDLDVYAFPFSRCFGVILILSPFWAYALKDMQKTR
jgi:hypothetical protein